MLYPFRPDYRRLDRFFAPRLVLTRRAAFLWAALAYVSATVGWLWIDLGALLVFGVLAVMHIDGVRRYRAAEHRCFDRAFARIRRFLGDRR